MKTRRLHTTEGSLLHRALKHRLLTTNDRARAERSRFSWRPGASCYPGDPCHYELSLLGVLNGTVGLVLVIGEKGSA